MAFAWDAASLRATVEDRSAVMRAFKLANSGASSRASRTPSASRPAASAPPDPAGGTNNRVSPAPALAPSSR